MSENIFQIDKQELVQEEKLLFEGNVPITIYVRDCGELPSKDGKPPQLKLVCVCQDGEHKDKAFTMWIKKDMANAYTKRRFISLAKAFFTDDELEKGLANAAKMIGKTLSVIPTVPREYLGKMFQDFNKFELVEGAPVPENEIPY